MEAPRATPEQLQLVQDMLEGRACLECGEPVRPRQPCTACGEKLEILRTIFPTIYGDA